MATNNLVYGKAELAVFERLWQQASARGWDMHPAELEILPGEHIGLPLMTRIVQKFDEERNKRVPAAVLSRNACMACWKSCGPSTALSSCVCCDAWSLCSTCYGKLEGNCFQCLFTDQKATAEEIKATRPRGVLIAARAIAAAAAPAASAGTSTTVTCVSSLAPTPA